MRASALAYRRLVVASQLLPLHALRRGDDQRQTLVGGATKDADAIEGDDERGGRCGREWTWDEVWSKAYREDIVTRWKTRHPEFREEMEIMENLAKSVRDGSTAEGVPAPPRSCSRGWRTARIKIAGVDMPIEKLRALEMGLGHAAGPDADTEGLQEFLLGGRKSGTPLVASSCNGELSEADRAFMSQNGLRAAAGAAKEEEEKRAKEAPGAF